MRKRAKVGRNHHQTEIGAILRRTREEKGISQTALGKILEQKAKVTNGNQRVSCFELGKSIPSDAEVTVLAQALGLSVPSLREKRDIAAKQAEARKAAGRKRGAEKLRLIRQGKLAPANGKSQAPAKRPAKQDPADAPALADFVELIDGIAPMPTGKEDRKLWFAATMELYKIGQAG